MIGRHSSIFHTTEDQNAGRPAAVLRGALREGKLYQRARNYQLALDYYKKAIELDPNFAPAYRENSSDSAL